MKDRTEKRDAKKYADTPAPEYSKRNVWTLDKGRCWNPLRNYPRNRVCYCGSKKKFKKCCLPKLEWTVPEKKAKEFEDIMRRAGLKPGLLR